MSTTIASAANGAASYLPFIDHAPEFSEEDLALEFAAQHTNDLRYVDDWGKWLQVHDNRGGRP
jgi:hypothetical protein